MTELQREEIAVIESFVGGFWYDRPDDDSVIIEEIFDQFDVDAVQLRLALLRRLLESSLPIEDKAKIVKRSAWRYFEDAPTAVAWLERVVDRLDGEVARRSR